jgi:carbon starvation protein
VSAFASCMIATGRRGERVSPTWLVIAAVCVYLIAYRFCSLCIANSVLAVDPKRLTPAVGRTDGLDCVSTDRYVLFGHHFAAIAGAGPLVGPVLAAQTSYLPGTRWILAGVVLAGGVQDLITLFISTRRGGRSFGELIRMEVGPVAGSVALVGTFVIMIIILAALARIVVKALSTSPWGSSRSRLPCRSLSLWASTSGGFVREIGEASTIGAFGLIAAIVGEREVASSHLFAQWFTFTPIALRWLLTGYGAVASLLPVWLLLAPRDYLSTFLKIGAITALALGIMVVRPSLEMPAVTPFAAGGGPVWSGGMFPFLFIIIACGAASGFHALIASGTTPELIASEADLRCIGYGAMLAESCVAMMALVAASIPVLGSTSP